MSATGTVRSVVDVARDRNITLLAAGFAYYAFVSIIPLLVMVLVVGSLVGGEAFAQFVVGQVESALSQSGADLVRNALTGGAGRAGAGAVSFLLLVWSALKVFRGLDIAFAEVYEVGDDPSLPQQVRDGLVALGAIAVGIALMVAVGAVLGTELLRSIPYLNVVGALALLAGLTVTFLPLYYVLPPVEMSVRAALPGAAVAAVSWLVMQFVFQAYLANSGKYQAYGVLGAVLLFVTYLYFAGIVILLGATVNYVLGRRATV
ncbi:YihY/virulence factor BrkB family protein [Halomarina litorea]|uniref:YihY/virulence factor BrkB family protein n=1 Tax=Halomarina litorea TaxID=2961595 RepID=UPI0020C25F34|nr:YihY/virulence factor BrkB family protein [Halomarina sp. BCD28]